MHFNIPSHVCQVHVESRAGVAGALSRVLAVTVCYESNGESRSLPLVVKLPPRDPFGRLFVAEAQFDTREILFYTELAPALNKIAEEALGPGSGLAVPKCVKARLPGESPKTFTVDIHEFICMQPVLNISY